MLTSGEPLSIGRVVRPSETYPLEYEMNAVLKPQTAPNHVIADITVAAWGRKEINIAEKLNIHFVVLSAVNKTKSHPNTKPIGWNKFQTIANKTNIPIYALGGLSTEDYEVALENGAVGIASQRSIWK